MTFFVEEYVFFWVPLISDNYYNYTLGLNVIHSYGHHNLELQEFFVNCALQYNDPFYLYKTRDMKIGSKRYYCTWVINLAKYIHINFRAEVKSFSPWFFDECHWNATRGRLELYKFLEMKTSRLSNKFWDRGRHFTDLRIYIRLTRWSRLADYYGFLSQDLLVSEETKKKLEYFFEVDIDADSWVNWWNYTFYIQTMSRLCNYTESHHWLAFFYKMIPIYNEVFFTRKFYDLSSFLIKCYEIKWLFLYKIYIIWSYVLYNWSLNCEFFFIYMLLYFFIFFLIHSNIKKYQIEFLFRSIFIIKAIYGHLRLTFTGWFLICNNPYHIYVLLRKYYSMDNEEFFDEKKWKKLIRRYIKLNLKQGKRYENFYLHRWSLFDNPTLFMMNLRFYKSFLLLSNFLYKKIFNHIFWFFDTIQLSKGDQFFFTKLLKTKNNIDYIKVPFILFILIFICIPFLIFLYFVYFLNYIFFYILAFKNKDKTVFSASFMNDPNTQSFFEYDDVVKTFKMVGFDRNLYHKYAGENRFLFWDYYFDGISLDKNRLNFARKTETNEQKLKKLQEELHNRIFTEYKVRSEFNPWIRWDHYRQYEEIQYEKAAEAILKRTTLDPEPYLRSGFWFSIMTNDLFGIHDTINRFDFVDWNFEKFYILLYDTYYDFNYNKFLFWFVKFVKFIVWFFKILNKFSQNLFSFFFIIFYYLFFYVMFVFITISNILINIIYILIERDFIIFYYYFRLYYSTWEVNIKTIYNLIINNKKFYEKKVFYIDFLFNGIKYIVKFFNTLYLVILNIFGFLKKLYYKIINSKIGFKIYYYFAYFWFLFFRYNICWKIFCILTYRFIYLFMFVFLCFSIIENNNILLETWYYNFVIYFNIGFEFISTLFRLIFDLDINFQQYIIDKFFILKYYSVEWNDKITMLVYKGVGGYKQQLLAKMYYRFYHWEADPYYWQIGGINVYNLAQKLTDYIEIYRPYWYFYQWVYFWGDNDISCMLHNRWIYAALPGNEDTKILFALWKKAPFYYIGIYIYYTFEWIYNYSWYLFIYKVKLFFLPYFNNIIIYELFIKIFFFIPDLFYFFYKLFIYLYYNIMYYLNIYSNFIILWDKIKLFFLDKFALIQLLCNYKVARFYFYIDLYNFFVKIAYIGLYCINIIFYWVIYIVFNLFMFPWIQFSNFDSALVISDLIKWLNETIGSLTNQHTDVTDYFSSIYNKNVGTQMQWKQNRFILYFCTRLNASWEVKQIDFLSFFIKALYFNEQIWIDFIFNTNYKDNYYLFFYKSIYLFIWLYIIRSFLTTFSLYFRKLFLFKEWVVPNLWSSWNFVNEENFHLLTQFERDWINSIDHRDNFKNYPELFRGDPFAIIDYAGKTIEQLSKRFKRDEEIDNEEDLLFKEQFIKFNVTQEKDVFMYNQLLKLLRLSMLYYDGNSAGKKKNKKKTISYNYIRAMNIYKLKLMYHYWQLRYIKLSEVIDITFSKERKFWLWHLTGFYKKKFFFKKNLSLPDIWYKTHFPGDKTRKVLYQPFNWFPFVMDEFRHRNKKNFYTRIVIPYIWHHSYNAMFIKYFFEHSKNPYWPYMAKFRFLLELKGWDEGLDIDFYEFSFYDKNIINSLNETFLPFPKKKMKKKLNFEKPFDHKRNINLFNLIMSFNLTDLIFIPYYQTDENDKLKKLFRMTDEDIEKMFLIERDLIKLVEFDTAYFNNLFNFTTHNIFTFARMQESKITVQDVTEHLDFWTMEQGKEQVEFMREDLRYTADDIDLENRRLMEDEVTEYFSNSILPTGKKWGADLSKDINKIAMIQSLFTGSWQSSMVILFPFFIWFDYISHMYLSTSILINSPIYAFVEVFKLYVKQFSLDSYLSATWNGWENLWAIITTRTYSHHTTGWIENDFVGSWTFFWQTYRFGFPENIINYHLIISDDPYSYILWPFKKFVFENILHMDCNEFISYLEYDARYTLITGLDPSSESYILLEEDHYLNSYQLYVDAYLEFSHSDEKLSYFTKSKIKKNYNWDLYQRISESPSLFNWTTQIFYTSFGIEYIYPIFLIFTGKIQVFLYPITHFFAGLLALPLLYLFGFSLLSVINYNICKYCNFYKLINIKK